MYHGEGAEFPDDAEVQRIIQGPPQEPTDGSSTTLKVSRSPSHEPGPSRKRQRQAMECRCPSCLKTFSRRYNLKSHLITHGGEQPFACGVCGKAFARVNDLRRHDRTHLEHKEFVCGGPLSDGWSWGCGTFFARGDTLANHHKSEGSSFFHSHSCGGTSHHNTLRWY